MKNISSFLITAALICFIGCAGIQHSRDAAEQPVYAIKNLADVPASSLSQISPALDTKEVYVFVHPSYYIFFHDSDPIKPDSGKNVVETFIDTEYNSSESILKLLKEYEREEMQFLSSAGNDKRIVIIITPGDYTASSQYVYKDAPQIYAKYINEVTKGAGNIFYLESKSANTGKMSERNQEILLNFLRQAGTEKVYLGGGYIGRCQKEVYNFLAQTWSKDNVAIIPELSAFSPDDISESTAKMLLTADLKLNKSAINSFITNGGVKGLTSLKPNLKNISKRTINSL